MKVETSNKEKQKIHRSVEFKQCILKNHWVEEEITKGIRKYFELNKT